MLAIEKNDALERAVLLTHALLGLPESVKIVDVCLNDIDGQTTIHLRADDTCPAEDDHEYDLVNKSIRHYRDMGDGIKLLWITPIVTGNCETCGKDVAYCNNECGRTEI